MAARTMHSKVVVIGSGPAAHTAAIYLARAQLEPVLYEGMMANGVAAGGQLTTTTDVENFPGFPTGVNGSKLMDAMREQSVKAGTKIVTDTVVNLDLSRRPFQFGLEYAPGEVHTADAVILATGASAKRLGLPGEDVYWQQGISACAVCDGAVPIFRDKPLFVIGGGDSAAEEALFLTKYGQHVTVLVRKNELRASSVMKSRLEDHKKVTVRRLAQGVEVKGDVDELVKFYRAKYGHEAVGGENGIDVKILTPEDKEKWVKEDQKKYQRRKMTHLVVEFTTTTEKGEIIETKQETVEANGLFYAIGHNPATELVRGQLEVDTEGYVITQPGTPFTSIQGVFACGDVQDKRYRQAITSAGTGCMAAMDAEKYIADLEVEEAARKKATAANGSASTNGTASTNGKI
ncbi:hypothetical protein F5B22DRAFT_627289 [Xylaria bambusicola]|uniref:uncharacterized protein n=1 Tax=Xylaria bambusicola TaxID=326684 RepID=UPI002007A892|nr:uncharacterized protein F5B22DRAFT_627289 [Xylaria bambusicola]KAI0505653.1 hypothetical protein F5B22DRAFT_627289 [Xylaria bambusicola]